MVDPSPLKKQSKISPRFIFPLSRRPAPLNTTRRSLPANPELLAILVNFSREPPTHFAQADCQVFQPSTRNDEAKYVESGWLLLKGEVRSLAWGPLVALCYAPAHLFVGIPRTGSWLKPGSGVSCCSA